MGLYDVVKDAAKAAQKADNIELYRQLVDAQQMALEMQNKISQLESENEKLQALQKLEIVQGHTYLVDPDYPERILCPVCTQKTKVLTPLEGKGSGYCFQCKGNYR